MKVVFDTEVILKFYLDEAGAETVESYLSKVRKGEIEGFMSAINLTELYYILYRKSPEIAEEKLTNLRNFGVKQVDVKGDSWKEAAKIKAMHSLSLADAFAVATAKQLNAKLLIGRDVEFKGVKVDVVRI